MEEMFKTLPQHSCSGLKGRMTLYNYQGFWNIQLAHEGAIMAQQKFKARPSDVLLCSSPKTGTTWLKALTFAIVTREKFNEFNSPLLTALPHAFVPFIETELDKIDENHKNSSFSLMASHVPYTSLPESVIASDCKIVYIYRNIKDVVVSNYHFWRDIVDVPVEDVPFDEAFEEFC
ncbi:flavonol 4'-sulfotransferase [Artemisia annua]|uniref:Sulfotransferase n=1 Tax=Artemisia annua TaxID=35608 RepID=A0A2U1NUV5_ARTAN|nr:flavonol 4'-sulfotransferase [Artemisia annua]